MQVAPAAARPWAPPTWPTWWWRPSAAMPPALRARDGRAAAKPKWINLEYLSAEEWVADHTRCRRPTRACRVKHYFFPGFTPKTGGLLREEGLFAPRRVRPTPGRGVGLLARARGRPRPTRHRAGGLGSATPYDSLARAIAAWGRSGCWCPRASRGRDRRVGGPRQLAAQPATAGGAARWRCCACRAGPVRPAAVGERRELRARRGFLRARPVGGPALRLEHLPTEDGAHWVKLAAFLARYTGGLDRRTRRRWWRSGKRGIAATDHERRPTSPRRGRSTCWRRLRLHAREWSTHSPPVAICRPSWSISWTVL